jgi:L-lactate dehydrogenase complex protein LldG
VVERFAERLAGASGVLHVTDSRGAAVERARELVAGATVTGWEVLEVTADPREAEVSVIVADVGVADTGAIGFAHGRGRPRAAGLLPDRQIALLARADLVATMAEALRRYFAAGAIPSNVVFAAGPSRTADIEQRMMLGVHAPRSLDVIVYG